MKIISFNIEALMINDVHWGNRQPDGAREKWFWCVYPGSLIRPPMRLSITVRCGQMFFPPQFLVDRKRTIFSAKQVNTKHPVHQLSDHPQLKLMICSEDVPQREWARPSLWTWHFSGQGLFELKPLPWPWAIHEENPVTKRAKLGAGNAWAVSPPGGIRHGVPDSGHQVKVTSRRIRGCQGWDAAGIAWMWAGACLAQTACMGWTRIANLNNASMSCVHQWISRWRWHPDGKISGLICCVGRAVQSKMVSHIAVVEDLRGQIHLAQALVLQGSLQWWRQSQLCFFGSLRDDAMEKFRPSLVPCRFTFTSENRTGPPALLDVLETVWWSWTEPCCHASLSFLCWAEGGSPRLTESTSLSQVLDMQFDDNRNVSIANTSHWDIARW